MEEGDDDLDLFGGETGSPLLGPEELDDEDSEKTQGTLFTAFGVVSGAVVKEML